MSPLPVHIEDNLAYDPSFEEADPSNHLTAVGGVVDYFPPIPARSGARAVSYTRVGTGGAPWQMSENNLVWGKLNRLYRLEIWARAETVVRPLKIFPRFFDEAGAALTDGVTNDGDDHITPSITPLTIDEWYPVVGQFRFKPGVATIPSNAARFTWAVGFQTNPANGEIHHFDDVAITPLEDPLEQGPLKPGGTLELLRRIADHRYERLAFVTDLVAGLTSSRSLITLDTLTFSIPKNRFVPSQGSDYASLNLAWNENGSSPYDKGDATRSNLYLFYRVEDDERRFRIVTLDYDNVDNLSGKAMSSALLLSDYLTQYVPGQSRYSGALPSEIAENNLKGRQNLPITNRRFVRDLPPTFSLAADIPDMTPQDAAVSGVSVPVSSPLPFVTELVPTDPGQVSAFAGLPVDTVPPAGTIRDLPTGSLSYVGFNDSNANHVDNGQPRFANFMRPVLDDPLDGPINYTVFVSGTAFRVGEHGYWTSRVLYGAIKTTVAGPYSIRLYGEVAHRLYFRGRLLSPLGIDASGPAQGPTIFSDKLKADTWYPIIVHNARGNEQCTLVLEWKKPGDSNYSLIPAINLSPQLFDGYSLVRVIDSMSVTRYLLCYKRWDGKALVIAFPLPATTFSNYLINGADWPKSVPAGALVEEVRFPTTSLVHSQVHTWGSGWTRKPGYRTIFSPPKDSAVMARAARGY